MLVNPAVTAAAASNTYCDNAAGLNLTGSNPLIPGSVSWSVVSQPAGSTPVQFTNQNSPNANVKKLTKGTYVFRYTMAGLGTCAPASSDVTINSTCFILPVKLSYFKAEKQNCNLNRLSWHSETEDNFRRYDVEYSINGQPFTVLASVSAKGSGSDYSFDHYNPYYRTLYRVKMVDADGQFNYSTAVEVNNSECIKNGMSLYPVPAEKNITVNMQSGVQEAAQLKIFDASGKLVITKPVQITRGLNVLSADISGLASGSYTLMLQGKTVNERSGFIKR